MSSTRGKPPSIVSSTQVSIHIFFHYMMLNYIFPKYHPKKNDLMSMWLNTIRIITVLEDLLISVFTCLGCFKKEEKWRGEIAFLSADSFLKCWTRNSNWISQIGGDNPATRASTCCLPTVAASWSKDWSWDSYSCTPKGNVDIARF